MLFMSNICLVGIVTLACVRKTVCLRMIDTYNAFPIYKHKYLLLDDTPVGSSEGQAVFNETDTACIMCRSECRESCKSFWTGPRGFERSSTTVCFDTIEQQHAGTYIYSLEEAGHVTDTTKIKVTVQCKIIQTLY